MQQNISFKISAASSQSQELNSLEVKSPMLRFNTDIPKMVSWTPPFPSYHNFYTARGVELIALVNARRVAWSVLTCPYITLPEEKTKDYQVLKTRSPNSFLISLVTKEELKSPLWLVFTEHQSPLPTGVKPISFRFHRLCQQVEAPKSGGAVGQRHLSSTRVSLCRTQKTWLWHNWLLGEFWGLRKLSETPFPAVKITIGLKEGWCECELRGSTPKAGHILAYQWKNLWTVNTSIFPFLKKQTWKTQPTYPIVNCCLYTWPYTGPKQDQRDSFYNFISEKIRISVFDD